MVRSDGLLLLCAHPSDDASAVDLHCGCRRLEVADREELFANPTMAYTQALLSVVPLPGPVERQRERCVLEGDITSPIDPPLDATGALRRRHSRSPRCLSILP